MKKTITLLCVLSILVTSIPVYAQSVNNESDNFELLRTNIFEAVDLLEEVLDKSYSQAIDEMKTIIVENGYDYEITMENFYENSNPFKQVDYVNFIAAYSTIKGYYKNNYIGSPDILNNMTSQLYKLSYTNSSFIENTPINIYEYELLEDGTYKHTGDCYITDKTEVNIYEETQVKGIFNSIGSQFIEPEVHTVSYANVSLSAITTEELFYIFNVDVNEIYKVGSNSTIKEAYEYRVLQISNAILNIDLNQSIFLQTKNSISEEEMNLYINGLPEDISKNRIEVIKTALSLVGNVPYEKDSRNSAAGYNDAWWTYNEESNTQKGLDSIGFIQWVYNTVGFTSVDVSNMNTIKDIEDNLLKVTLENLQPGDIGLISVGESEDEIEHVGIYLGNNLWIHNSSLNGTVVISEYSSFNEYRIVSIEIEEVGLYKEGVLIYNNTNSTISSSCDDVYLLAQLICNEAGGEGLNGWIAVAEVVKNRLESPYFPNAKTMQEVIYAPLQFSDNELIETRIPSDKILAVAYEVMNGRLSILNNPDCLFFRNSMITSNIPSTEPVDWGPYKYFMPIGNHAFYLK